MPKPKDNDDQVFSSIFKYFLKSPKKHIICVCLNRIESMSLLCHHVVVNENCHNYFFIFYHHINWGTPKESHNKSGHFLRKYLNISEYYYQTKTNREMLQHDSHFFGNLMIFSPKKKWLILFSYFFSHLCANFQTKKRLIMTCVFFYIKNIVTFWNIYMNFCIGWMF